MNIPILDRLSDTLSLQQALKVLIESDRIYSGSVAKCVRSDDTDAAEERQDGVGIARTLHTEVARQTVLQLEKLIVARWGAGEVVTPLFPRQVTAEMVEAAAKPIFTAVVENLKEWARSVQPTKTAWVEGGNATVQTAFRNMACEALDEAIRVDLAACAKSMSNPDPTGK